MKKLIKRLDRLERDQELALKSNVKLKLGPRYKFGPFHLYRRILIGLPLGRDILDDILNRHNWKPKGTEFGEHEVCWSEWKTRISKVCPVQFYVREELLSDLKGWLKFWKIKDLWYYYKCKFFHPYNVLYLKTLPPTWADEDTLLTHGMFEVLRRFMEQMPNERHDYDLIYEEENACGMTQEEWEVWAQPRREFWKEISQVWDWWNKREERESQMNKAYKIEDDYKTVHKLEDRFEKEEDWALQTIVKHRGGLWV